LLSSDLAQSGTLIITVVNPPPGGGVTPAISFTVADYNVIAPAPSQTLPAGQQGSFSLTLAAIGAPIKQAVAFSVSGLPPMSTASFTPASVPAGSTGTTVALSITTTAHSSTSYPQNLNGTRSRGLFLTGLALLIGIMWFALWTLPRRARLVVPMGLAAMVLAIAAGLTGCGSVSGGPGTAINPATGTPAGSYAITVNATSGSATISTKVTLTVM
jgi:hypothetical protein